MGQQVETQKPSTHNGEQPRNKSKPNRSPIQIRDEQHQTTKVEGAKKPTKNYKTFDEFIEQTKKKLSFVDEEEQDLGKVVVEYEAAAIPIKFDYTSTEKPKPIATTLNASTRQSPLGRMGQQVETQKPSTHNGEQPRNKSKPNRSPIQIRDEQHQTTKVEGAKKPTKNYKTFDEFIEQTKKKLSFVDEEEQDLGKVVVEYGKNHHFSA
ncbi:hypothetical protein GOBAR_AA29755 [Gossypium barbadense]|uniref:Uncharacterized protein n=1 Tax=Gossypium barbadense TaxID=3634 RepID=A0A2P5WIM4_GOSBA|nr:hypothetical protein GOBAR_AA29755 [Gossypium barbadense]